MFIFNSNQPLTPVIQGVYEAEKKNRKRNEKKSPIESNLKPSSAPSR